jgi:molybdopterin-guanine dinucleotide biosynthesis protein A
MGRDKSLLPFNGYEKMIDYQIDRYSTIFDSVFVSSKIQKTNQTITISDISDIYSPLVAIYSAIRHLNSDIFITTVDTPIIPTNYAIDILVQSDNGLAIVAKTKEKIHPLFGIYKKELLPTIEYHIHNNLHKLTLFLNSIDTKYIEFDDEMLFANINTQENYENILKRKINI